MSGGRIVGPAITLISLLFGGGGALAGNEPAPSTNAVWRAPLARAATALAQGDARAAEGAWEEAFRMVMASRAPQGLLDIGYAYVQIGEARHDRLAALPRARQLFLSALFQARGRRDANGAAAAAEAFASLGDREVTDRACDIALSLAFQTGDQHALARVAALRARLWSARRAGGP